jgi:hypothetical protein
MYPVGSYNTDYDARAAARRVYNDTLLSVCQAQMYRTVLLSIRILSYF